MPYNKVSGLRPKKCAHSILFSKVRFQAVVTRHGSSTFALGAAESSGFGEQP